MESGFGMESTHLKVQRWLIYYFSLATLCSYHGSLPSLLLRLPCPSGCCAVTALHCGECWSPGVRLPVRGHDSRTQRAVKTLKPKQREEIKTRQAEVPLMSQGKSLRRQRQWVAVSNVYRTVHVPLFPEQCSQQLQKQPAVFLASSL